MCVQVWSKAMLGASDTEPVLLFLMVHASLFEKLLLQSSSSPEKEAQ